MSLRLLAWTCVLAVPVLAHADPGALTLSAAGTLAAEALGPPAGQAPGATRGSVAGAAFEVRYALGFHLEFLARADADLPATFLHGGVSVTTPNGDLHGVLAERTWATTGLVGIRLTGGRAVQPYAELLGGASLRRSFQLQLLGTDGAGAPIDQGVPFEDVASLAPVLAPGAGLQLPLGDRLQLGLGVRARVTPWVRSELAVQAALGLGWTFYP